MLRTRQHLTAAAALLLGTAAVATGASAGTDTTAPDDSAGTAAAVVDERQPDVNGDGTVKVGVISPGDTNDGGYYEAFVVAARAYTEANGWELTIVDHVNPADGAQQARNLCRQGMDLVAIAAAENRDAVPVAEEPGCENAVFVLFGDLSEQLSPSIAQVTGQSTETSYLIGVAAGLLLAEGGSTTAGYVAGPELDFAVNAAEAYTRGVQSIVADAEVLVTYTGSFDDGGKAREAVVAQTGQGATIIYTYLGGATDAAASAALEAEALSISPGTDRCDDADGRFAISGLYAPGLFFENLLNEFANGRVEVGSMTVYKVGIDPVPNAIVCGVVENAADVQAEVDAVAAGIADGTVDTGARAAA